MNSASRTASVAQLVEQCHLIAVHFSRKKADFRFVICVVLYCAQSIPPPHPPPHIFESLSMSGHHTLSALSNVQQRRLRLSPEQATDFYSEHYGKMFFPSLIAFMHRYVYCIYNVMYIAAACIIYASLYSLYMYIYTCTCT